MPKTDYTELINTLLASQKTLKFTFTLDGKPKNYVRERYSSVNKRLYNPKESEMRETRKLIRDQIRTQENYDILFNLVRNKEAKYWVELDSTFVIPVAKGDSIKIHDQKVAGVLMPTQRPDLDNYEKFILDTMHDVFYDDDCRVVAQSSSKIFGDIGQTILNITIKYSD